MHIVGLAHRDLGCLKAKARPSNLMLAVTLEFALPMCTAQTNTYGCPGANMQGDLCSAYSGGAPPQQRGQCRGESLCRTLEMEIRTPEVFFLT